MGPAKLAEPLKTASMVNLWDHWPPELTQPENDWMNPRTRNWPGYTQIRPDGALRGSHAALPLQYEAMPLIGQDDCETSH